MEVDIDEYKNNINKIQKYVGDNITLIPVIKANGYGTFVNHSSFINNFKIVAVALVSEGIILRDNGYTGDILVINQPGLDEIDNIIKYNITVGLSDVSFAKEMVTRNNEFHVHVEIDTGMGRTGIRDLELVNLIKNTNIVVDGVYTHLSSADNDEMFTNDQLALFDKFVSEIKSILPNIKYFHVSASNGILNYPNSYYNAVRVGIIMYGYESYEGAFNRIDLKPICKLKSRITFLKEVDENTPISYNHTFYTKRKSKIATIPIGYADGLRRELSNKGNVVINNKLCPIIGKVCMDSIMVDVTDVDDVKINEEVYIWDNDLITVEDIANSCNTINYEIISTISDRVRRKFIERN